MAIFAKFYKEKQANPLSQAMKDRVFALLEEHGITDKRRKNECFLEMTRRGIKYFVGLSKNLEPDSAEIEQLEEDMRGIVGKYGVMDKGDQELLITDYFIIINDLGEQE
jgi:hypothetical protein